MSKFSDAYIRVLDGLLAKFRQRDERLFKVLVRAYDDGLGDPSLRRVFVVGAFPTIFMVLAAELFVAVFRGGVSLLRQSADPKVPRSNLTTLRKLNDWIPAPKLRKQTGKMLAEQQAHIAMLEKDCRVWAIRFNVLGTWGLWAWYIAQRPIVSVSKAVFGKA